MSFNEERSMSSVEGSSSTSVFRGVVCRCKNAAIQLTSRTEKHPGEKIWRCAQWNESRRCKFFVWNEDIKRCLSQGGAGSNLEVNAYVLQNEELKQKDKDHEEKVASLEEKIGVYDEQLKELKKMVAKQECQCQLYEDTVGELKEKIAKQHMKTTIERKRVKVLGLIVVFLWCLLSVVSIAFAMK